MIKIQPSFTHRPNQPQTENSNPKNSIDDFEPIVTNIKHGMVGSALALATLTPMVSSCFDNHSNHHRGHYCCEVEDSCEVEEKSIAKTERDIELTEGFVDNRDIEEIKKITGLTEIEYKTATNMLLEMVGKRAQAYDRERPYLHGTSYYPQSFFRPIESFKIVIGDAARADYTYKFSYDKRNNKFIYDEHMALQIKREENGDYTCIGTYPTSDGWRTKQHNIVRNFTKDGVLKPWDYIPNTESEKEVKEYNDQKYGKEDASIKLDNNAVKNNSADIENIPFFDGNDKDAIAKFSSALGVTDIEYIHKNGTNILFANGPKCAYHMNLKKLDDDNNTFIGIVNKALNNGKSEIYLLKAEMFSTNKSDKLIISKMRVVQDGLDENSPIYKKYIKETSTTGGRTSETSHELRARSITPWFQLFVTQKFYDGKLSSKTVSEIDELVTESNSDGKVIKIISIDKKSGKITVQGE